MACGGAIDRHAAGRVFGGQIVLGRRLELRAATIAAEVKCATLIIHRRLARIRIDRHAAYGIARYGLLLLAAVVVIVVMTMAVMAVIVFVVQCHIKLHCPEGSVG